MAGLTYATYVQALQNLLVIPQDNVDNNFANIIPRIIEYAELRMCRDLDFLSTNSSAMATLSSGDRNIAMPGNIIFLDDINVVTPSTQTDPDAGKRNPLERVSLDFLNAVYTDGSVTGLPKAYALLSDAAIKLGPVPDAAYTIECIGNIRPAPLSPTNTTTWISTNLPDVFLAASMIFGSGYQQNFGSQSDNPQMATSWETQYQTLLKGAAVEEWRRKSEAQDWTPYSPTALGSSPRGKVNAA